tara:strand:- start:243 stop:536 length:294 start_codon:yes stop_codon:yes gene_type:complete
VRPAVTIIRRHCCLKALKLGVQRLGEQGDAHLAARLDAASLGLGEQDGPGQLGTLQAGVLVQRLEPWQQGLNGDLLRGVVDALETRREHLPEGGGWG